MSRPGPPATQLPRSPWLLALGFGAASALPGSTAAVEPTLKVSGRAAFAATVEARSDGFEVRGVLSDEVGRPLPAAAIRGEIQGVGPAYLRTCQAPSSARTETQVLSFSTDATGRFCLFVAGVADASLLLGYADPRGFLAPAERRVALSTRATAGFELAFDPPPGVLSLDAPEQTVTLITRSRGRSALPLAAELVLSLATDSSEERELARVAAPGPGEPQRLSVKATAFGSPGPARLLARVVGQNSEELAQVGVGLLRTATVVLALPAANPGPFVPGAAIPVLARSTVGPVQTGLVEARALGRSLAVARVRNGEAALMLPAAGGQPTGAAISIHYVGDGSGWLAGAPVDIRLRPASRNRSEYLGWVAAALFAALVVVLGWRRPSPQKPPKPPEKPRSRANVELIEAFGDRGGYRGSVCDSHDGHPVTQAAVSFLAAGTAHRVLWQARVGVSGEFSVPEQTFPPGTTVEVTAPFHATLSARLPPPGVIQLSMISRRRALLERLTGWAERHGAPWLRAHGEATPAHVVQAARGEGEVAVEQWAKAVEQLAYGPHPPDAAAEQAAGVVADPKTLRERGID